MYFCIFLDCSCTIYFKICCNKYCLILMCNTLVQVFSKPTIDHTSILIILINIVPSIHGASGTDIQFRDQTKPSLSFSLFYTNSKLTFFLHLKFQGLNETSFHQNSLFSSLRVKAVGKFLRMMKKWVLQLNLGYFRDVTKNVYSI